MFQEPGQVRGMRTLSGGWYAGDQRNVPRRAALKHIAVLLGQLCTVYHKLMDELRATQSRAQLRNTYAVSALVVAVFMSGQPWALVEA